MAQVVEEQADTPPPTQDDVREALQKLLASKDFDASERNRRFLSYVVEETLSGRGSRIKAYSIAVAAFSRGQDFDPLADPIVRIEASRLRRSLERYYLTAGKADQVRISMPKGSYVAVFDRAYADDSASAEAEPARSPSDDPDAPPPPTPPTSRIPDKRILGLAAVVLAFAAVAWIASPWIRDAGDASGALPRGPRIIVYPFEEIGEGSAQVFVSRGMTYDVIASLTRFNDLFVYGPETSFHIGNGKSPIQADFALTGSVLSANGIVRVSARLADVQSGQNVWSWSSELPLTPSHILAAQTDIAGHVARAVAQPYGTIFERSVTEIAGKPAPDLLSYECVVRFQQYWRVYDVRMYDDLVACMKETIARDPGYARAYSGLALLYVDAYRFGYGSALTFDPVQRALELAETAIKLEPTASDGYLALSVARWFDHDVEGGLQAARQGLALNPNNTILIGELGIRYALLARWDESQAMLEKFFALNPRAPAGYRRGYFLYAYMHGDYQKALAELMSAETPLNIYDYVFRAMTYAQLGNSEAAKDSVSELLKFDPDYGEHVEADFRKRNTDQKIVRAIIDGLTKAGLPSSRAASD